jgi:hypothetical protein
MRDFGARSVFKRSMPSDLIRGWRPVRVKKTRQIRNLGPRFDSIEAEKALVCEAERQCNRSHQNEADGPSRI